MRRRWTRDTALALVSLILILGLMMAFSFVMAHVFTSALEDFVSDG